MSLLQPYDLALACLTLLVQAGGPAFTRACSKIYAAYLHDRIFLSGAFRRHSVQAKALRENSTLDAKRKAIFPQLCNLAS